MRFKSIFQCLVVLAVCALAAMCAFDDAFGAELMFKQSDASDSARLLDVYNDGDIVTVVKIVNTTEAPLPLPRPCEMTTCAHPTLAPHAILMYGTTGSGTIVVNFDAGLTVYSEMASRFARLRVEPCIATEGQWFHDLIPANTIGYNSGVYVSAIDKDAVVSLDGGKQIAVRAGDAVVLPNTATVAHLITVQGSGKVCAFAYVNRSDNGSLFTVTH